MMAHTPLPQHFARRGLNSSSCIIQKAMAAYWSTVLKATVLGVMASPAVFLILFLLLMLWPGTPLSLDFLPSLFLAGAALSGFGLSSLLSKQKRVLHGVGAAILTPLTWSLLAYVLFQIILQPVPSDRSLIRRFERNEAVFNELRQAVQGEGEPEAIPASPSQSTENYSAESLELSQQQLEAYQADMRRLRLRWVSEDSSNPNVARFGLTRIGPDIEKYYLYSEIPPSNGIMVTEIIEADVLDEGRVYREIREGWYLYARPISD